MPTTLTAPKDDTPTTENPLYDTRAVMRALNCGRWKVWNLCQHDPDFPNPRDIAGKNQWFKSEIEEYKETRPRRQYTTADVGA